MCEFIQTTPTVSSYESYENVHYKPFLQVDFVFKHISRCFQLLVLFDDEFFFK